MQGKFNEEYQRLNDEQRAAVDKIDGPVLVIAGPGTGKTQLLASRVANILEKTDTNPASILCLTFTDKAATNLRERLLELIGSEARKVEVHTFHALGSEIINSYPDYFWSGAHLEPAPEAVKLEIAEDILSTLPLKNPLALKFAGQSTLVGEVSKAIGRAKDSGLTPGKLSAVVSANLAYIDLVEPALTDALGATVSKASLERLKKIIDGLPDEQTAALTAPIAPISRALKQSFNAAYAAAQAGGKNTPVSNWKKDWSEARAGQRVLKDRQRSQWWLELAAVYEAYQTAMAERGYYDYADMILEAITQLEQRPKLAGELRERYLYLMIDEFQDTNDAQFRLGYLIAQGVTPDDRPNIMAVGDDDQAIYRFQGAQLTNFRQFMDTYRVKKPIVLTKNYRSHQSILDAAATVAGKIDHRLVKQMRGVSKDIVAAKPVRAGHIEQFLYPAGPHQLSSVAELIKRQFKGEKGRDIAVLARQHDSLEQLSYILQSLGVPLRYERKLNVLDSDWVVLILDLLALLEAIQTGDEGYVNANLPHVLAHRAWGIKADILWQLAAANYHQPHWLNAVLTAKNPALKQIGKWLLDLAHEAQHQPLAVTIEHLLGLRQLNGFQPPVRAHYLTGQQVSDEYVRLLSALRRLRQLATEFAKARNPSLEAFNNFIRLNREHSIVIADESAFTTADRAVNLMTVHKAKGLEFDTVYVIDAVEPVWRPRKRRRIPPSNLENLQEYGEDADDYARLFYVAVSRAKRGIIVSGYQTSEAGAKILPTPLARDIARAKVIELKDCPPLIEIVESASRWPTLNHHRAQYALRPILESYQLSVTGLLNFLDVTRGGPPYFFERNVLRLPEVKTAQLAFGSAVHAALEYAQRSVNQGKFKYEPVEREFSKALTAQQMPTNETERYAQHGAAVLKHLFGLKTFVLPKGSLPERALKNMRLGKALIQGKLDRLDRSGQGIHIVDYKTGKPLSSITTKSHTEGLKAWRQRTQLVFYALLARERGLVKPDQAITASMIYVEADTADRLERHYQASEADIDRLSRLIQSVWQHVMELNFPDTAHYGKDLAGVKQFEDDLIEGKV